MIVRDLGTLLVEVDGDTRPPGGRKPAAILAALSVNVNQRVPVDTLIDAAWGAQPASVATLESHVWRLRRLLEPDRHGGDRPTVLVNDAGGYRLLLAPDELDSSRFALWADDARSLLGSGRADRALERIDAALELWRGRPFSPFSGDDWAEPAVARLDEIQSQLVEHRIDALLEMDEAERALAELEVLLRETPYRERLWGQQMTALYRRGRGEEALQSYQRVRLLLRDELGTEPGAELRRLHQDVLAHDPRLLVAPREPPSRRVEVRLPTWTTPLIGRETESAALMRLLPSSRMVSLVGTAGCGKTRLAVDLARTLAPSFPDGVYFVDLAAVEDPQLVIEMAAGALGVAIAPVGTALDAVRRFAAERRMLLVLDNCEQVLATVATICRVVLSGRECALLTTTREPVGVEGEIIWTLAPLDVPTPDDPDPLSATAAQLFIARAREADPTLTVGAVGAEAVRRVCVGVDGLPLALELAAARARAYSLEEIADQVDGNPLGLAPVSVGHGTRRSLGLAIDASYRLLSEPEQHLHRDLSVFPGAFTHTLATAVVGDEVDALLPMLVNRSLLSSTRSSRAHGPSLFRQLVTVRRHAARTLAEANGASSLVERRDAWVRGQCESAPRLGRVEAAAWYQRVDDDYPTFRAMLQHTLVDRSSPTGALVAPRLIEYWYHREQLAEGVRYLRLAVEVCDELPTAAAVHSRLALSYVDVQIGRADLARPHLDRALADLAHLTDAELPAAGDLLAAIAIAASTSQEFALGAAVTARALQLAEQTGDLDLHVLADAACCLLDVPRTDPAEIAARAEAIYDRATAGGHLLAGFMVCIARALAAIQAKRPHEGVVWSARLMDIASRLGAERGTSAVEIAAMLRGLTGEPELAVRLFAAARAHARRASTPWPRRPLAQHLLERARHDLTRPQFDRAWAEGERLHTHEVLDLIRPR